MAILCLKCATRFDCVFDESSTNELVYKYTARNLVHSIFEGGMATCFAYGQTGSGKSWSVVGYGQNKGIVPMFANQLFAGIREGRENTTFEVKLSMLEIYNEVARDLLDAKNVGKKKQSGLKIRQHPKKGFYGKF